MIRFKQINKSCRDGTLPLDNYSGFKPGDRVRAIKGRLMEGEVYDVRFINSPKSALYYVQVMDHEHRTMRTFYPEQLRKVNL